MSLLKRSLFIYILIGLTACKKEQLYFEKTEIIHTNTESRLNKIRFINDSICMVAGGERFLKAEILLSKDGGYNWQSETYPEVGKGLYGVGISPSGTIYTSAFDGKMLISRDNAQTWEYKEVGNWEFHVGMSFVNDNKIVMISRPGQQDGKVVIIDSNAHVLKDIAFPFGLNDIEMVTDKIGYISAFGTVLKTFDGGESWIYLDIKNDNFLAMHCNGEYEVWVCGYAGSVYHTTDGGDNWERLRNGNSITLPKYHLQDILFTDSKNGWAVGEKGLIIYTNDGGRNWNKYNKLTDVGLNSIAVCPNGDLLVAGEYGTLFRIQP